MYIELTLELQDLEELEENKKRFMQISSLQGGGIVIGAIDQDGDLLGGYFENLGMAETIQLRDFLNYFVPYRDAERRRI